MYTTSGGRRGSLISTLMNRKVKSSAIIELEHRTETLYLFFNNIIAFMFSRAGPSRPLLYNVHTVRISAIFELTLLPKPFTNPTSPPPPSTMMQHFWICKSSKCNLKSQSQIQLLKLRNTQLSPFLVVL